MNGAIIIANGQMFVTSVEGTSHTTARYDSVTIENLKDAARVLAAWMNIPSEDLKVECQRVHDRDQQAAELRDIIQRVVRDQVRDEH